MQDTTKNKYIDDPDFKKEMYLTMMKFSSLIEKNPYFAKNGIECTGGGGFACQEGDALGRDIELSDKDGVFFCHLLFHIGEYMTDEELEADNEV